ncbi:MAG TPA: DUF3857 domain-containing protein [Thermoanaerobaculia bacterium]|nr:DUF3857 domain-containing protein [Thermoanaerobaculia bacterium]HUM30726.1 DUF3857 domain-containing protein [Thermoanaerobaculia bacterium]HXK68985.1 DUF3857 domain-containing protein [Thermoanaerobaculia bacterium]
MRILGLYLLSLSLSLLAADPATVLLDETVVLVEDSGLAHVTHHVKVRIDSEKGIQQFSHLRFDYDPATSLKDITKAILIRSSGEDQNLLESEIHDLPQPQYMIYWGARMKLLDVPRLEIGDILETETTMKGFQIAYLAQEEEEKYIPPMRGHYYDSVLFGGDLPITEKRYTIRIPRDKELNTEVFHGELASRVTFDETHVTYTWWKKDIPALKKESRMVDMGDVVTKLVLATVPDWETKSRWFFEVNDPQFEATDEIRALVGRLTSGCEDDDCRFAALLHWVANNIRYSGLSMGKGEGYTLHPGSMIFDERCGVCKDIAGMLITFLRAAGYTVYPAMTMAGARVEDVPADQFNHCVVAVKRDDGSFTMLDPTWCPFSRELWSSAEAEQHYVIGSPEGETLTMTPAVEPSHNRLSLTVNADLDSSGNLKGTMDISGDGFTETNLRWGIINDQTLNIKRQFQAWIASVAPTAIVSDVTMNDPYDLMVPLKIRLTFSIPGYARTDGSTLYYSPLMVHYPVINRRIGDFLSVKEKGDKRTYPVFLRSTRYLVFKEQTRIPRGMEVRDLPDPVTNDGPAARYSRSLRLEKSALITTQELELKKKIVPPEDYSQWKESVQQFKDAADILVTIGRTS